MQDINKNGWAVITAEILYSEEINDGQKLLMAMISNLSNKHRYCFASNEYLSKLTGKSERTISRDIKALHDAGFIGIAEWVKLDGKLIARAITPKEVGRHIWREGVDKFVYHNNIKEIRC